MSKILQEAAIYILFTREKIASCNVAFIGEVMWSRIW